MGGGLSKNKNTRFGDNPTLFLNMLRATAEHTQLMLDPRQIYDMTRWRSDVASKRRGLYQSARLCRLANVIIGDKSGTRSDDDDRDEGRT